LKVRRVFNRRDNCDQAKLKGIPATVASFARQPGSERGWISNLLIVLGCVWAYSRQPEKPLDDIGKLCLTFALATGFFAADMALFQPQYLGIFPRLLHPHLP
jgi:hypothetical protein